MIAIEKLLQAPMFLVRDLLCWFVRGIPTAVGVLIRLAVYRLFCNRLGRVKFQEDVVVSGLKTISIGDGSFFMARSSLYADQGILVIGKRCACNHNVMINACHGRIVVGNDVIIGPNVVIRAADHAFDQDDVPIQRQGHTGGTIQIDDNVWIGANAVVTQGVRIGSGAVVGAGAVVTRDIPPNTVVGGVPAKVIKKRGQ